MTRAAMIERLRVLFDDATHDPMAAIPDVAEAIEREANDLLDSLRKLDTRATQMMELIDLLASIFKPEGVGLWLLQPNTVFDGRSPWQVIREDDDGLEQVNIWVQGMADGVFT